MNKIHRTLWNANLGAHVAAPENARAGHGGASRARRKLTPLPV
ncbi:MAG: hypothetical protein EOO29_28115 [Comamonadaceae bacterium]|nr:MAG: hypothetical protein EOO29_28115 [Comamonadaceae bacterium]